MQQRLLVSVVVLALSACSDDGPHSPASSTGGTTGTGGQGATSGGSGGSSAGGTAGASGAGGASSGAASSGGASRSGGSGGSGGANGSGGAGPAPRHDDPKPVDIDRTSLIPASGHGLIFSRDALYEPSHLIGLDLENGALHDLTPSGVALFYDALSPDGQTFLFSGSDASVTSNMSLVRALDDGFIPAIPVKGFEGKPGNHYNAGWTEDGRFAYFMRGYNGTRGIEIVDAWRGAMHWSIEPEPGDGASILPAPRGLWFAYGMTTGTEKRTGLARITDTGAALSPIDDFSAVFNGFTPDGTRVLHVVRDPATTPFPSFYRDLVDGGTSIPITAAPVPGCCTFHWASWFAEDRDHVVARFSDATGSQRHMRGLSLVTGESNALGELGHELALMEPFAEGREVMVRYEDGATDTIAIVDPTGTWPDETIESYPRGDGSRVYNDAHGPRHAWYLADSIGLNFVARDANGALQRVRVVSPEENGRYCEFPPYLPPPERFAHVLSTGGVALIDLTQPLARRAATLAPQHGGKIECPLWSADGTAMAVSEHLNVSGSDTTKTWLYVVRWPRGGEPGALEMVHQADEALWIRLVRP